METITSHHRFSPSTSLDTMVSSSDPPTFLKLEDLHNSSPAAYPLDEHMSAQATPPPVIVQSKPAKKRKSWGEELPEPTTNLPPRKRAKTEEEKEQRRIERIKRNRAAAHNSRERKRQETDVLAVALARANAELDAYRKHFGALPAGVVLPEVTLSTDGEMATPAPSLIESRGSVDASMTSPSTPVDNLFDYPVTIKEEEEEEEESTDSAFPSTLPPAFDSLNPKPTDLAQPLDQTQHSAAMLCDLQCRSSRQHPPSNRAAPSPSTSWWTTLFLHLICLQLRTGYRALLLSLWTISPSRTMRLMQASTHRWTSRSTTSSTTTPPLLLSRATRVLAQQPNAATSRVLALQRASSDEVRSTTRVEIGAAEQRYQPIDPSNLKAFGEHDQQERDLGNGDGDDGGVGR